jgi:hypothetical protein
MNSGVLRRVKRGEGGGETKKTGMELKKTNEQTNKDTHNDKHEFGHGWRGEPL